MSAPGETSGTSPPASSRKKGKCPVVRSHEEAELRLAPISWTPLLPLAIQLQLKVSKQKTEIMKAMAIKRRKGLENRKRRLKRRHSSKISLVWPEFQEVQPNRKRGCAFAFHMPNNYLSLKMPIYLGRLT